MFKSISIIGCGLIGGSIAKDYLQHTTVNIVTKDVEYTKQFIPNAVFYKSILELPQSDVAVIAVPLSEYKNISETFDFKKHKIVIDIGSVKRYPEKIMGNFINFVGCHPIAGREFSGIENSVNQLFYDKQVFITKNNKNVIYFWSVLGSKAVVMKPQEHDILYAKLSHFIHLVSFALNDLLQNYDDTELLEKYIEYRNFRRIGFASKSIWLGEYGIFALNSDNIMMIMDDFKKNLYGLNPLNIIDFCKEIALSVKKIVAKEDINFFGSSIISFFEILKLQKNEIKNNKLFDISNLFDLMMTNMNYYQ